MLKMPDFLFPVAYQNIYFLLFSVIFAVESTVFLNYFFFKLNLIFNLYIFFHVGIFCLLCLFIFQNVLFRCIKCNSWWKKVENVKFDLVLLWQCLFFFIRK